VLPFLIGPVPPLLQVGIVAGHGCSYGGARCQAWLLLLSHEKSPFRW
jgi:hypothetical protein